MSSSDRDSEIQAFLTGAGWADAARAALAGDASTRRYERLTRGGERAILMDAPPGAETAACPPEATPEERRALGYNAMARLAGPNAAAFTGLADWLSAAGLSAPYILAADIEAGLILLEDMGDAVFAREMTGGADESILYGAAVEALIHLHDQAPPERVTHAGHIWPLLSYDATAAKAEADLLLDWYLPHRGVEAGDEARSEWEAAWAGALADFPVGGAVTLRDYHAENLIWLPDRTGRAQAGLLDFQDALAGHPAYDLVSLTEDARRDVSLALQEEMVQRYLAGAAPGDAYQFRAAYAVWGAQRNAKILGIFVRLARRDGKARYLDLLARVEAHFRNDLRHEALQPVRSWLDRNARGVKGLTP